MQTDYEVPESVARLLEVAERIRAQVLAIRSGSSAVGDDLAVALHILTGRGDGYGLAAEAFNDLGIELPTLPTWARAIPDVLDDHPVTLGLRAMAPPEEAVEGAWDALLGEPALRVAIPGLEPQETWSRADIVKQVRNKFGGHADQKPPRWLKQLRYFPAGDSSVLTLLNWSMAEVVLSRLIAALADAGFQIEEHEHLDPQYLAGVELREGLVLDTGGGLDARAYLRCETWRSERARPIIGSLHGERPFIFGLLGDGRLTLTLGSPKETMMSLRTRFGRDISEGLSRAQRRERQRRGQ